MVDKLLIRQRWHGTLVTSWNTPDRSMRHIPFTAPAAIRRGGRRSNIFKYPTTAFQAQSFEYLGLISLAFQSAGYGSFATSKRLAFSDLSQKALGAIGSLDRIESAIVNRVENG